MKRFSLILAAVLVILADAFVLIGVASNRSAATSEIELTERELTLQQAGEDNTGVSLRLNWIGRFGFFRPEEPGWFDKAKLAELGFDVRMPVTDAAAEIRYRDVLPRDAFVVLEYDGAKWEEWVKQQETEVVRVAPQARSDLTWRSGSRLIAIDAGRDPAALRRKYHDPAKHLIASGVVRLIFQKTWDPKTRKLIPPASLRGEISSITPDEIHISLPLATALSGLVPGSQTPRYAVTLRYGTHYEPWVVNIRRM